MELDNKLEERKQRNAPFMTAFERVRSMLGLTKGKMCEMLKVKASRLSEWDKGEKLVPEPVKYDLIQMSVDKEIGQISIDYLDGYTDIMLQNNITVDEQEEIKMRRNNPDYDKLRAMQKAKWEKVEGLLNDHDGQPTPSSIFNANLAQQAESVEAFRIALSAKDELIKDKESRILELHRTIDDKDFIIKTQERKIVELEKKLSTFTMSSIDHYPFPIGAADDGLRPNP